jgi:hypothetical protein
MRTAIPLIVLATGLGCSFATAPAHARARVFVASYGNDSNPCTFGSPCKTFQQAVDAVDAGGEVTAIDSAGFGPISITKAVTITSPDGVEAGIVPNPGGNAITINTTGDVFLRGLTIEGNNSGVDGINESGGGTLGIVHCVIRHFTHDGIYLQPTGILQLSILDTIASNNGNDGIDLSPSGGTAGMVGVIDHATASSNGGQGISLWGANSSASLPNLFSIMIVNSDASTNGLNGVQVFRTAGTIALIAMVRDSIASSNGNDGLLFNSADISAELIVSHSVVIGNRNFGMENVSGVEFWTYNDNNLFSNFKGDESGTIRSASFE